MTTSAEVVWFLQAVATLLVAVVGWFLKRTLDRLDEHLDAVEERQEKHHGRISHLEGWQRAVAPQWVRRRGGDGEP